MKYYSQIGQDKYLDEEIFKKKRNGIFLDIGAGDGIDISNSYFFEKNRGWTGICIEPKEKEFIQLIKNRGCICENCCIADFSGSGEFLEIEGHSSVLSGLLKYYDPRHLQRIKKECQEDGQASKVITVKCMPLNSLLIKHNIKHIDFCSIDTEGSELAILRSIDFSQVDINFFTIENNFNDPNIRTYMFSKGYKLIKQLEYDDVYKKITWFENFFQYLKSCIKHVLFRKPC